MVHQTSLLVGSLSVADNLMLSLKVRGRGARKAVVDRLAALSRDNGLESTRAPRWTPSRSGCASGPRSSPACSTTPGC